MTRCRAPKTEGTDYDDSVDIATCITVLCAAPNLVECTFDRARFYGHDDDLASIHHICGQPEALDRIRGEMNKTTKATSYDMRAKGKSPAPPRQCSLYDFRGCIASLASTTHPALLVLSLGDLHRVLSWMRAGLCGWRYVTSGKALLLNTSASTVFVIITAVPKNLETAETFVRSASQNGLERSLTYIA
ncbi:hypothetical protein B0H14DRAFT_2614849 [Mycena olivaceomarginata]|nr:hypothetical protein B0H14DRAFT_2614849 [Mycena olivaceomarginata]